MFSSIVVSQVLWCILLVAGTAAVLVAAVVAAVVGASLAMCLAIVAAAPLVTVVGYEAVGHRHLGEHVERLRS